MKRFIAIAAFLGMSAFAEDERVSFGSERIIGTYDEETWKEMTEGVTFEPRPVSFSTNPKMGNWDHYEGLNVGNARFSFGSKRQTGILGKDEGDFERHDDDQISFLTSNIDGKRAEQDVEEPVKWTKWESAQEEERKAVLKAVLITFFATWVGFMVLCSLAVWCGTKYVKKRMISAMVAMGADMAAKAAAQAKVKEGGDVELGNSA